MDAINQLLSLTPSSLLDRLMLALEMPLELQPSRELTHAQRCQQVLEWAKARDLLPKLSRQIDLLSGSAQDNEDVLGKAFDVLSAEATSKSEIYSRFASVCARAVTADSCAFFLLNDQQDTLTLAGHVGERPIPVESQRVKYKLGEGLTGWVAKHAQPVKISDLQIPPNVEAAYPGLKYQPVLEHDYGPFCAVPISSHGTLVGVLRVARLKDREPFSEYDIEILQQLAIAFLAVSGLGPPCDDSELVVELWIPDDVGEEQFLSDVETLSSHIDDLHRAIGGNGLKVNRLEVYEESLVPEGVPNG